MLKSCSGCYKVVIYLGGCRLLKPLVRLSPWVWTGKQMWLNLYLTLIYIYFRLCLIDWAILQLLMSWMKWIWGTFDFLQWSVETLVYHYMLPRLRSNTQFPKNENCPVVLYCVTAEQKIYWIPVGVWIHHRSGSTAARLTTAEVFWNYLFYSMALFVFIILLLLVFVALAFVCHVWSGVFRVHNLTI